MSAAFEKRSPKLKNRECTPNIGLNIPNFKAISISTIFHCVIMSFSDKSGEENTRGSDYFIEIFFNTGDSQ